RRQRQKKRQAHATQEIPRDSIGDILWLVFSYVSPKPPPECTGTQLLKHLARLQNVAGVNRQWREIVLPLFYQVAAVVFVEPSFNIDEIDGLIRDDNNDKGKDEACEESKDGYSDEDNDDYVDEDSDDYSDEDSDDYSDESSDDSNDEDGDEHDGDTKMLSNIRLIRYVNQVKKVREMRIVMQGKAQKIRHLTCMLTDVGLWKSSWPNVERLQFDMLHCSGEFTGITMGGGMSKGMKELNKLLSRVLPALREISFRGDGIYELYYRIPIQRLIVERLFGPKPLRVLKIESDCSLSLDDCEEYYGGPVALERMCMNCEDPTGDIGMPMVLARNLVELSFTVTSATLIWIDFEIDGAGGSSRLVFSRLRSLNVNISTQNDMISQMSSLDVQESRESPGYLTSPQYGKPRFPVLTNLDIRYFPKDYGRFLSLFADSPITRLTICGDQRCIPNDLDLSRFRGLRSLTMLYFDLDMSGTLGYVDANLRSVFATTNPGLQHLTLVTTTSSLAAKRMSAPAFADNLVTLTLSGEINLRTVELFLPLFPNLQKLHVSTSTCPPLSSPSIFVQECRRLNTPQLLAPLNRSLRVLQAEHCKYFTPVPNWPGTRNYPMTKPIVESLYRGLLLNLVSCLPSLDILQANNKFVDVAKECINALAESCIAPGHLQNLRLHTLGD
ncbi:hypothetical protein FBU31_004235, partial [Coemansia sp. 'formosensis']